jgi:hypothetical protein
MSSAEQSHRTSTLPPGAEEIEKLATAAAAVKHRERAHTVSRAAYVILKSVQ